jgi:hypothetical protein
VFVRLGGSSFYISTDGDLPQPAYKTAEGCGFANRDDDIRGINYFAFKKVGIHILFSRPSHNSRAAPVRAAVTSSASWGRTDDASSVVVKTFVRIFSEFSK